MYEYDVTGTATSSASNSYQYANPNLKGFEPDEANGVIYTMCGGIYGVGLLYTATDNYSTLWPFSQPYGAAVSYNPANNVVFAAGYSEVAEFNRTTGVRLNDWVVVGDNDTRNINGAGLAATVNNNAVYVRENTILDPGEAIIGFISTTGLGITLVPSETDSITLPSIPSGIPGQQVTLTGTDLSGLPINYVVVSGPGKINGDVLTFTGTGTVVISASTTGNGIFEPASSGTESIVVALATQTISAFGTISNQVYKAPPFAFTRPTSTSGLPVTIHISGPAKISGNIITVTGVGAVTLTASQGGNSLYQPATPVSTSFLVTAAPQTIAAFATIPSKTSTSAPFKVTAPKASSGLPVTLSVSGPATISGATITITGTGTVTVAADQDGNVDYLAAPEVTTSFIVAPALQTISKFAAIPNKIYGAAPFTITLPTASSQLPVTVTVLSGAATISSNTVTLTGVGTVTLAANADFAPATQVTTSFIVSRSAQKLAAFATIPTQIFGESPFTVTPPVATSGLAATLFVASGPATISGDLVTITGVGTVKLGAMQNGDLDYLPAPEVYTSFATKEAQTISAFTTIPTQTLGEAPFTITLPTATSGLVVKTVVLSGPARIIGNRIYLTGFGTVVLAANLGGNSTYAPAAQVTTSFLVQ
jgi:hypothetical protein